MRRNIKQFLALAEQLDEELEKSTDIFISRRPFLMDAGERVILDRTEEEIIRKVDNDYAIEELVKKICSI